jgi:hypothetical protein
VAIDYAALNALTSDWGAQKAQLDDNENRLRINYNNVLDRMKRNLGESTTSLTENLGDRGMVHSGAAVKANTDMRSTYNRSRGEASEKQNLDLATIARKRLEADKAYNTQKILLQIPPPVE